MKNEPVPLSTKSPKERFHELGSKLMTVPKAEIERREKEWRETKRAKGTR